MNKTQTRKVKLQYDPPYARIILSTKTWEIWAALCFLFEFKNDLDLLKYKNLENLDRTLFPNYI